MVISLTIILFTIAIMKAMGCSLADTAGVVAVEVSVFAIPLGSLLNALLGE